ncbi:MAG: hypothetical protein ACFCVA_18270 [Gammaproteobacteria bacterium]
MKSSIWPFTLALSLASGSAYAELQLVERDSQQEGATTVTWDASFEDLDYTLGESITMVVNWDVDAGYAKYGDFTLRGPQFTPKGRDPAAGTLDSVELKIDSGAAPSKGSVEVTFPFTDLHFDEERQVDMGNAHFSLQLDVDTDGEGAPDSRVDYGVNVHVED